MAAKKTVAAKVASGTKKAASSDVIFSTAQEVENVTAVKAFAAVEELSNDIEANSFKLGGYLAVIQDKCDGGDEAFLADCKSFREVVEQKFSLHYRKAAYLASNYKQLVEKEIPYSEVAGLGWPKIAVLAPVLTAKNVAGWVKKAKAMTYRQLVDVVAKSKAKGSNASETAGDSTMTSITLKLKADQKEVVREALDKAKSETATEFDSVAITNICTGYLGGSVQIVTEGGEPEGGKKKKYTKAEKKAAFKAMAIELGLEDTLEVVGEAFPQATIDVTVPD